MERVADLTERYRRAAETTDFLKFVFAQAKFPIGPSGSRNFHGIVQTLKRLGSARLIEMVEKSTVGGNTTQSGSWGADLSKVGREWLDDISQKSFLGKLVSRRVPFVTRTNKGVAPAAAFVGPGVGIAPARISADDTTYLKRTAVATIAAVTNELVQVWAPGTRENLDAVLTRSVVRGIDAAALDPLSAAVTDERPASLFNGVAALGTLGSTVATVLGQVQDMLEVLVVGGSDLDAAMFVLHPLDAIRLSSLVTTEGVPAFPALTAIGGSIMGIPVATSVGAVVSGSPTQRVFGVVDGAQILVADDGEIAVSASDRVSLQMTDAPTQDARAGTGSTLVSLFQTDTTAIKVVRTINWERAQDAAVSWLAVNP